ncbi:MAG TPA: class I SAM-dependent methyltransferase [Pseudonocardiaceae bacterium]|nr:class I SAM-dependent methyltransferase [Pseudonocardiaceae bacterium]
MEPLPATPHWDSVYRSRSAPWLIDQPQPTIVALERDGWIRGSVLDVGCGAGEHTIALTAHGHDVLGVDFSPAAVDVARASAAERNVPARFEVADALDLGDRPRFDTIVDSALFHIFDTPERTRYVSNLSRVCRPGGRVFVLALALSDTEPGFGPRISDTVIRDAFGAGWTLEELQASRYRVLVDATNAARSGLPAGSLADLPAWLARIRRA